MSNESIKPQHDDLREAVEGLYVAFASYGMPKYTNPCRCCHTEADEELLRSRPLRELGAAELNSYGFDALLTWGDAALFKHFMPRIYELMVFPGDAPLYIDAQILLSKLRHGHWGEWPEDERRAVRTFLQSLWHSKLGEPACGESYYEESEMWLSSIAQAEDVMAPYLTQWETDTRLSAAELFSAFILRSSIPLPGKSGRNAFWDGRDAQYEEVQRWVFSEEAKGLLKRAMVNADEESRAEFEAALSMLSA